MSVTQGAADWYLVERQEVVDLRALVVTLEAERKHYRELVQQHAQSTGQKVGYVTRPAALSVALDRYRAATETDSILALLADRTRLQEALAAMSRLAREATNGWACFATRKAELDEIARLHREIDALCPTSQPETLHAGEAQ